MKNVNIYTLFFFLTIFLSVNWMYLIFLSAPSLFHSNILFKASIHAKAIYLQMFHHLELLWYLDILHVLKAKGESIQRSPRKYCWYVTERPSKKKISTYFMASRYHGTAVQWHVKNPEKQLIRNNLVIFTLRLVSYGFQFWPLSFSQCLTNTHREWNYDVIALSYGCGMKPSV